MTDLRLSRRAVTRALATLPIIAVPAVGRANVAAAGESTMNMISLIQTDQQVVGDRNAWSAAVNHVNETEAAWRNHHTAVYDPLRDEAVSIFGERYYDADTSGWARASEYDEAGKHSDELCASFCRAEDAAYETDAPDLPALRWKVERMIRKEAEGTEDFEAHSDALLRDLLRLLPVED